MIKYLKYELKRNLLPLAVFTAVACLICAIFALTSRITSSYSGTVRAVDSVISAPTVLLCILCTLVPVQQFSFRMERRSADLWYSLPVRRKTQTFVRLLAGLILVFAPYTLAYWLQFILLMCRENVFVSVHYLSFYLASVPLGACLFGVNCFIFSRANTLWDGLLFLIGWSCALTMPFLYLNSHIYTLWQYVPAGAFFTYSPLSYAAEWFDSLICADNAAWREAAYMLPIAAAEGIGAYTGLFLTAKQAKAENAEQLSESILGYKTLIPLYIFFLAASTSPGSGELFYIFCTLILVGGFVAYIVYRRSFRLKKRDIIALFIVFAAGIAFAFIGETLLAKFTDAASALLCAETGALLLPP